MNFEIGKPDEGTNSYWTFQIDTTFLICEIAKTLIWSVDGVVGVHINRYKVLVSIAKLFDIDEVSSNLSKVMESYITLKQSPKFIQKSLEEALEDAIRDEDFKLAAKIRDEIEKQND